ncbi:MAG: UMF2 family MFS superfamily transporter [Oceanicaulis sp. HLUCCA04]|nr:MAG: UMF2 family MFS superfamily transporter [Oceanicaulis sp. HLUCCA04]
MVIYRNIATVLGGAFLLQASVGVLGVSMPLAMLAQGWSGTLIGFVAASYGAGFMLGAWFAPSAIRAIGHIRAYAAFAGLSAALTLMLALDSQMWWWLLARFGFGVCTAGLFAVAESWIADATPSQRRGAVISAYQIVGRAGLIFGPFLIALPGLELTQSFIVAGIFLALALVPVTVTRRAQPAIPEGERAPPWLLFRIAPAAALAAFIAGVVNTGLLAFIPIWADSLEPGAVAGGAAIVMAVIYGASMIVQWPVGRLSDRLDRRWIIAGAAALGTVFALILAIFINPGLVYGAALAGAWGAVSLSYYGVAVAHAADRSTVEELPAIASGVLMLWAAGSMIGPVLAGIAYESVLGSRGLFLVGAIGNLILCAGALWRARIRAPVRASEREPFVNLMATSAELAEIEAPEAETAPRSQGDA